MSHHHFPMAIWNDKLHSPLFAQNGSSPSCNPQQSCHIRNSWRTRNNVIATDSRGLLKIHRLTAYSVSGVNLVRRHLKCTSTEATLGRNQRHSRWAIAPLSAQFPCSRTLRIPPSAGKKIIHFHSFSFREKPARKHDYNSGLPKQV
jgi:hypothetical protein